MIEHRYLDGREVTPEHDKWLTEREQRDEILYDLTWNLAKDPRYTEDNSRERYQMLQSWTDEFSRLHANTDWNKADYIIEVDTFYSLKAYKLWGAR